MGHWLRNAPSIVYLLAALVFIYSPVVVLVLLVLVELSLARCMASRTSLAHPT